MFYVTVEHRCCCTVPPLVAMEVSRDGTSHQGQLDLANPVLAGQSVCDDCTDDSQPG